MGAISVRLPDSLHRMAREVSAQDHVSLNQFIASAVAEKVAALTAETYLAERARRGSSKKFRAALDKVPDVPAEDDDRPPARPRALIGGGRPSRRRVQCGAGGTGPGGTR